VRTQPIYNIDYPSLVSACERVSRKEIVETLTQNGFAGKANVWQESAAAPEDAEKRLADWNMFSQFELLRDTHASIHANGESPERLGVLVRAYGQLGTSARAFYGPQYAVFSARSLLYADRLVARDHGSAFSLWHRAYARALA